MTDTYRVVQVKGAAVICDVRTGKVLGIADLITRLRELEQRLAEAEARLAARPAHGT